VKRGVVVAALCLSACAADPRPGGPAAPDPAALIPPLSFVPGWTLAEETTEYDPVTLYEYLNGGAEGYLAYGFQRLAHARFALGADDASSVAVDVYDMGSKLGAFGIFSSGRHRDAVPRDWGAEGYRSGEIAAAWKGRVYVHARADEDSASLTSVLERLVDRVIDAAPGDASPPEILQRLPAEGLVPQTTRYVAEDLLGHAFLPGGVLAHYDCGPEECLLFLCELGSPEAARRALERLHEYESSQGALLEGAPGTGEGGFRAKDPGLGPGLVTRLGGSVAGVWGGGSPEMRESLLDSLAAGRWEPSRSDR
jgi:hypothetical protein